MLVPETQIDSVWRNRSFILLFGAQIISLLGSGATTIGLALFAFKIAGAQHATVVLGNALTLRIAAFLLFSQPAGVLADRANRKRILVAADVLRAGLLATLPFATTVFHIYLLIFAINAVTAFFTPTYEASIPSIVGERDVVKALSLSRVAVDIEAVAAPAAAGLIVVLVGARWIFWFDAGTYLLSAALVIGATVPHIAKAGPRISVGELFSEVTYGVRAIARVSALRSAIALSLVEATAGAAAIVGTVAYVKNVLHQGDTPVAVAMAALGLGSATAAFALGRATGRYESPVSDRAVLHGMRHGWTRRALLAGGFGLGLILLPGVLKPPVAVLAVLWAANGAGQALIAIGSSTLLAEHTRPEERGRVYAAHFALTHACWLLTYPFIGQASAVWGTPVTFTIAGIGCVLISATVATGSSSTEPHVHDAQAR